MIRESCDWIWVKSNEFLSCLIYWMFSNLALWREVQIVLCVFYVKGGFGEFWWEVRREGSSACIYEEDWGTQVATALPDAIVARRHCCASSSCGFPTIFSDGMADPASYGNHERDVEQVSYSHASFKTMSLSLYLSLSSERHYARSSDLGALFVFAFLLKCVLLFVIFKAIITLKKGSQLIKYSRKGKPKLCPFRISTVSNNFLVGTQHVHYLIPFKAACRSTVP